ncbi:MAG TPA: hypothetical protein PLN48_15575 [Lachnospiraceae bacterium]|nr:hypothetical protein [Lachnospiraceae bacterium]
MSKSSTDDMIQFMSQYSLESVLSGIIEMQMLLYGHDDTFIPAAEYLAANALYACKEKGIKNFMWHDYELLEQYSKNSFVPNVEQLFSETLRMANASDDEKQKFLQSKMMQMKGNFYRGDGYIHQLLEVARRLYAPLDSSMKDVLGFSYTSYEKVLRFIFSRYVLRISEAYKDKYKLKTMIKALTGKTEPWLPSIKMGYVFRISKADLKAQIGDEVEGMCDRLCVKAYDSNFKKVEFDEFKILTSKPFVDFGDYIYMPLLFSTLMNIPKQFHYTFIAEKVFDNQTVGVYTGNRGDVVEELTSSYLERLLSKEKIHRSLSYLDEDGEADVTTVTPEGMLFCECKSKIITLNSIKGLHESIKTDVYQAIGAAYSQAVRSIERVQAGKKFVTVSGDEIVIENSSSKYIVCVTAENFGIIPSEIDEYIEIDETFGIPYVVNIYDLDIITQECESYYEFIQYIEFRKQNYKILSTLDELDAFGYFKKKGNTTITVDADEFVITDFTAVFDKKYKAKDKQVFQEFFRA